MEPVVLLIVIVGVVALLSQLGTGDVTAAAEATMRRLNPNAAHAHENGREIFVEDVADPDGRMYRLEYQTDTAGRGARAFCRHNPWGGNPYGVHQSHLFDSGQICLGARDFSLEEAVERARFWCTAYSYFREHGYEATHRAVPEW